MIIKLVKDMAAFFKHLSFQFHEYRELIISCFNVDLLLQVYSRDQKLQCHRGMGTHNKSTEAITLSLHSLKFT